MMSKGELPDDVDSWPSNPFQLLGVSPDDDHKAVKRAYTRLIRRFKPEHYPEQFRRLREAYEAITAPVGFTISDWVQFGQLARPASANLQTDQPSHPDGPWSNFQARPDRASSEADPNSDVFPTLWRQARGGQIDDVLEHLRSGDWQGSQLTQAKLMEYWLAKLKYPDPSNALAGKILVENLHCFRRMPKVLSIARHELYLHPDLARLIDLEKCFDNFFTTQDIHDIIRIRWDAAVRAWNFGLIRNDYEQLALRFFDSDARETIGILAIDRLIWSSHPEDEAYTTRLMTDLEAISGLRRERWADFDRIDYLVHLHRELVAILADHPEWRSVLQMVRWMWNDSEPDFLKAACDWLVSASNHSAKALAFFDCIDGAETLFAFCIAQFERAIRHSAACADCERSDALFTLVSKWQSEPPNDLEVALIEEFLGSYNDESYERFRTRTAEFCLREHIPLQKLIRYVKDSDSLFAEFFQVELIGRLILDRGLQTFLDLMQKMAIVTCAV